MPPQVAQSGLLSLADELLLSLIDQIDSREALRNLAATCCRLQALVEPYIWRSLFICKGSHARDIAAALDSRDARVSYIRELSIRYPDHARDGIQELNHFILFMDQLRELTIESSCPNNTEWKDNTYFDGWTRIDYTALLEASVHPRPGLSPAMPMLQSLTLHGHGPDTRIFTFGRCAVMFLNPSLRHITLSCTNFSADVSHDRITDAQRRSTPLTSLTLIECNVNVKFLDVVLSLPKALKELHIGERLHAFPGCYPDTDETTRTSQPTFIDALARQAHSLERLSHTSGALRFLTNERSSDDKGQRKFRSLNHLRYLELGIESTLMSYLERNDYPDSLECLKVTDASWASTTTQTETFIRHPGSVLQRCYEVIKHMTRPIDLEVRYTDKESEVILGTIPSGNLAVVLLAILGGPVRAPLYKLASALKDRGKRLRLCSQRFPSGKAFIPPYMYGEDTPSDVEFYDSEDFWRMSGRNFRIIDDEEFQAEVEKRPKLVCVECLKKPVGWECHNSGDGTPCFHCEQDYKHCEYDRG